MTDDIKSSAPAPALEEDLEEDLDLFERLRRDDGIEITDQNQKRHLGRGGFATVYRGTMGADTRQPRPCAVKIWDHPANQDDPAVRREFDNLAELLSGPVGKLPNVVTLLKEPLWVADHNGEEHLVTVWELADRTLQDLLRREFPQGMTRQDVCHFLADVARALDDLAQLGQTHRDVKPANVLLFGNRAKLGDFGLSRLVTASTVHTTGVRGTLEFMPAEALSESAPSVSPTFDAYSFGVMYAYLRRGRTIFGDGVASSSILNLHMVQRLLALKQEGRMDLDGLDADEVEFVRAVCAPDAADRPRQKLADLFSQLKTNHFETPPSREESPPEESRSRVRQNAGQPQNSKPPRSEIKTPGAPARLSDPAPERAAAHEALIEATNEYAIIETELLAEQAAREELLQAFVPTGQAVREQDAVLAEIIERLQAQKQQVQRALDRRDAADAGMIDFYEQAIATQQAEKDQLTDPDGLGYRSHVPIVKQKEAAISDLHERQTPFQPGRLRALGEGEAIDLIPFCQDVAFSGEEPGERRVLTFKDLEIPLRWCPPGRFRMGSPAAEENRSDDENQVDVTLTQGCWMFETLVTQQLYQAVTGVTIDQQRQTAGGDKLYGTGPNHPMYYVSHDECVACCQQLTAALHENGILPATWQLTLPTEAQSEYARRAGTTTAYYWGHDANQIDEYAWHDGNSNGSTHPVGQKKPNDWGLFDMTGLLWEWCADWYDDTLAGGTDPHGPSQAAGRVSRGGSWGFSVGDGYLRSAYRYGGSPDSRSNNLGFRVACSSVKG